MIEVHSIRNSEIFAQKPELKPVRDAIICVHDFLGFARESLGELSLDNLDFQEMSTLCKLLGLDLWSQNGSEELVSAYWFYRSTRSMCTTTAIGIGIFLDIKYPDEYESTIVRSIDYTSLNYFAMHDLVISKHKKTGLLIGSSVGNIFNKDLSFPKYKDADFQRATSLIVSDNKDEIVALVTEIEGGIKWQDKTDLVDSEPSYSYICHTSGERKVVKMSEFIRDWKGE